MSDLKGQIKEIDNQIQELRNKRYELEKNDIASFKEQAKANVGRCFLINGHTYVKVIGVPQEFHTKTGIHFNEYQYPALYLGYDTSVISSVPSIIPFYEDTLFSAAWGNGSNILGIIYKEISQDEFNAEFEKRLQEFRERVGV